MVLPGPEAQQLAIYIGWLLHRTLGGLIAGIGFVAPSALLMLVLSWAYAAHGDVSWVSGLFAGLTAGVLGLVVAALLRLGSRALGTPAAFAIAAASFVAIFLVGVPFPVVVVAAGVGGAVADRVRPGVIRAPTEIGRGPAGSAVEEQLGAPHTRPSRRRTLQVLVVGLAAWWVPLLAVIAWRGPGDTLTTEALFFSGAAMVTFGGAYAVLAFVNQAAVVRYGWLSPGDVVAGLGLAESTPGPLIMVVQFVGFLAAYRFPGDLPPLVAGVLGSAVTVWATFAPCFLWISSWALPTWSGSGAPAGWKRRSARSRRRSSASSPASRSRSAFTCSSTGSRWSPLSALRCRYPTPGPWTRSRWLSRPQRSSRSIGSERTRRLWRWRAGSPA